MILNIGPFQLYRTEHSGTLDITLRCIENWPCGWEYGWRDDMRGPDYPWVDFRVGKLQIFYFERYKNGFELWLMGFWWIV